MPSEAPTTRPGRTGRALLAVAIGTGAFALATHPGSLGEEPRRWITDLAMIAAASAAAIAGFLASRRARGRARAAWGLVGAGAMLWGLGEATWGFYELALGREVPFPSLADVFYLAAIPVAAAGVLLMPAAPDGMVARLAALLDGTILACSILLMSWVLVLAELVARGEGTLLEQAIALAYPLGDVVIIVIALLVLGRTRNGGRAPMLILTSGLILMALSDSAFAYLEATTDGYALGLIDSGWLAAYLLMALAAFRQRRAPAAQAVAAARIARTRAPVVPYAAALLSVAVRIARNVSGAPYDSVTFWIGIAIVVLVLARLLITTRENAALTRTLETKVRERTAALHARERWYSSLVRHASDVVVVADATGSVHYATESVERVFGYEPSALAGTSLPDLVHPQEAARVASTLLALAEQPGSETRFSYRVRHARGGWRSVETVGTSLVDDPVVAGIVLTTRDVTERAELEGELRHQAFHDSLTGTANRALLTERIGHALTRAAGGGTVPAIVVLDLNRFKAINDSMGHAAGDELLRAVAGRLGHATRAVDTVARLGGDEFAILIEDGTDVEALTHRLAARIREPFLIDGNDVRIDAAFGVRVPAEDGEDVDHMLRDADLAMYRAKRLGGGIEVFDATMHEELRRRIRLERDLHTAVEREELRLVFQPIVSLPEDEIHGFEALVRWQHPEHGEISPGEFVPIAEETGLIGEIGTWVLDRALAQAAEWDRATGPDADFRISVNLSVRQLLEPGLCNLVAAALAAHAFPAHRLELEVTESALLEDTAAGIRALAALRALGVRIAIDDFGTGYSSLNYLAQLPADVLKIDRAFVSRIGTGEEEGAIVRAIVKLAKTFKLHTIAEGIETAEQASTLRAIGCDEGQGFLFARPLEPQAAGLMLASRPGPARDAVPA